jgi:hypothetical protein
MVPASQQAAEYALNELLIFQGRWPGLVQAAVRRKVL